MDDKTKLAIREEVEQRLNSPPATFAERIENEVEKRVEQRVKGYKILAGVVVFFVGLFAVVFWNASLATIRQTVAKELSEQEVVKASKQILETKTNAENASISTSNSLALVKANEEAFLNRLAGIKGQDNVVLVEDLAKLFVIHTFTNFGTLKTGSTLTLDYEVIPHSLKMYFDSRFIPFEAMGTVQGKTFVFTEPTANIRANSGVERIRFEYVRKTSR